MLWQVLKDTTTANPFRNRHVTELMHMLEKQMGRSVAHKPKMLSEESLTAMLEEVRRSVRGVRKSSVRGVRRAQLRLALHCSA